MQTITNSPFRLSPTSRANLAPSATLHINERVKQMWREGRDVYHLGFGESRFPVHPRLQEALAANVHRKSYLSVQGLLELREEIAGFYSRQLGREVSAEQVLVGPGSKGLIYGLQLALDGELLLPTPSWVSYEPQAHLLGKAIRYIPASPADNYEFTLEALDQTVQQQPDVPKTLLINSPNNPTGRMFEPSFLEKLADYCRQQRIMVLSDEIYGFVPHAHATHVSLAHYYPEGTVVLGGLSKHLSLGGWRLGVAVLPAHEDGKMVMRSLCKIASETWSTPSGPIQYAAISAYREDPDIGAYIDECARLHAIRTQHIWSWLVEFGISCAQPDGAFYMFPNFDRWREPLAARGVHTSTDLATYLLEEHQIATLPGIAFGTRPEELSLRLATSYLDMENDQKADAILAAYRNNPDPQTLMEQHHPATAEAIRRFGQFVDSLGT
ncbi:MAG: pyridoxal phosphate-dependent aminotransferase [Ardenticatenaceae bacterium]